MTFEEAIRRSIKAYFDGKDPTKLNEVKGEVRYTREYFDEMEEELIGNKDAAPVEEDMEEEMDEDAVE
jgi:hypothetical protein